MLYVSLRFVIFKLTCVTTEELIKVGVIVAMKVVADARANKKRNDATKKGRNIFLILSNKIFVFLFKNHA
jgi:hypothetical protein